MLMKSLTVCVVAFVIKLTDGVDKDQSLFEDNERSSIPKRLNREINDKSPWIPSQNLNNYANHEQMGIYNRQMNTASLRSTDDFHSSNNIGDGNNQYRGLVSNDKAPVYSANNNFAKSRLEKNYNVFAGRLSSQNNIMLNDDNNVVSRNSVTKKTAKEPNITARINNWNLMQPESQIVSRPIYKDSVTFQKYGFDDTSAIKMENRFRNTSGVPTTNLGKMKKENITYPKSNSIFRQAQPQFNSHYRSGTNRMPSTSTSSVMVKAANPSSRVNGFPNTAPSELPRIQNNDGEWYPYDKINHANTIFGNSKVNTVQRTFGNELYNKSSKPNFSFHNFQSASNVDHTSHVRNREFYDRIPYSQKKEMDMKLFQNKKMSQGMTDSNKVDFNPLTTGFWRIQDSKNTDIRPPSDFSFHNIQPHRLPPSTRNIVGARNSVAQNYRGPAIQRQYNKRIPYSTSGSRPYQITAYNSVPQRRSDFENNGANVFLNANHQNIRVTPRSSLRSGIYYPKITPGSEMKKFNPRAKSITSTRGGSSMNRDISSMTGIKHVKFSTDLDLRQYEDKHRIYVTGYGMSEISGKNSNGESYEVLQSIGYYKRSAKPVRGIGLEPSDKSNSYVPRVSNIQKLVNPITSISQQNSNYVTPLLPWSFIKPRFHQPYTFRANRFAASTYPAKRGPSGSYFNYNEDAKSMFLEKNTNQDNLQDRTMNKLSGGNNKFWGHEPTNGYIESKQNQNIEPLSSGLLDLYYSMNKSFNAFFLSMSNAFNRALYAISLANRI